MAYTAWSVVFGEQPSAAKWNQLGTNDASFNDSTGINLQYNNLAGFSNPYKFAAYASGAQTLGAGTNTKVLFATEEFDSNNNFASSTYTAPVAGFYMFVFAYEVTPGGSGERYTAIIYKNGSNFKQGQKAYAAGTSPLSAIATELLQLAASDTVEFYGGNTSGGAKSVTNTQLATYCAGYLISKT